VIKLLFQQSQSRSHTSIMALHRLVSVKNNFDKPVARPAACRLPSTAPAVSLHTHPEYSSLPRRGARESLPVLQQECSPGVWRKTICSRQAASHNRCTDLRAAKSAEVVAKEANDSQMLLRMLLPQNQRYETGTSVVRIKLFYWQGKRTISSLFLPQKITMQIKCGPWFRLFTKKYK